MRVPSFSPPLEDEGVGALASFGSQQFSKGAVFAPTSQLQVLTHQFPVALMPGLSLRYYYFGTYAAAVSWKPHPQEHLAGDFYQEIAPADALELSVRNSILRLMMNSGSFSGEGLPLAAPSKHYYP